MKTNNIANAIANDSILLDSINKKLSYYENLMKNLLYSCEKCDGALVQLATCVICKRTAMRICVKCNSIFKTSHESCKIIQRDRSFTHPPLGSTI